MQSHQLNHAFINYKHNRWVVNIGAIAIAPYGRIKEQPMKLRNLHIENYKMFKDFDISFVDENDEPLLIVVLAGINGSGKTTLLEYIYTFIEIMNNGKDKKSKLVITDNKDKKIQYDMKTLDVEHYPFNNDWGGYDISSEFTINITYFPSGIDTTRIVENKILSAPLGMGDIKRVENLFVKYWYNQVKFHNKRNNEITEVLQKFIFEILKDLEFDFTYSHIDEDDNIFFKNIKNNEKFKKRNRSIGRR